MTLHQSWIGLSSGTSTSHRFGLPPELLARFRGRVRLLSSIFLFMCVAATAIEYAFNREFTPLTLVYVVNGVGSLAVYLVARAERLRHGFVLDIALGFEVVMCMMVSLGFSYVELQQVGRIPGVTWICIVIVMYPLIVPSPPRPTLVTALAAAATAPISAAVLERLGVAELAAIDYAVVSISPAFCVPVAVLASRVVHGLSRDVAEARQAGRYALTDEIGSGGRGELWRAEHQMLARPAAVKLIRLDAVDQDDPVQIGTMVARFEQEVQATALLRSPHTVDVYDFGVTDDGAFYYVMELLEGLDLQTLVDKHGPLPAERVVYLLAQACQSLEEAHASGLVHRDIKPANLLACRYGVELDFLKVLDFGLVKEFAGAGAVSTLTRSDLAVGTPSYMAPEMTVARATVDDRADLYSLGCVGYWLLTGTLVFPADTAMEVVVKHARDDPEPPSMRTELKFPAALEDVVMACLEKDPVARPESAAVLRQQLETVPLEHPWSRERRARWWAAHRPEVG